MKKQFSFHSVVLAGMASILLISCDKDFNEIGSEIVGDDHFGLELYDEATVIANNNATGAIQSNNLDIMPFGIYQSPIFGKTTAEFVTQLELANQNPQFNTINTPPAVDSVTIYIPYFSTNIGSTSEGGRTYELDSIFGPDESKMNLTVVRSGFFLRDTEFNEEGELVPKRYYTDQQADFATPASGPLNNDPSVSENTEFFFSKKEIVEKKTEDDGDIVRTRFAPGIRLHLDKAYFEQHILNAPAGSLVSNNAFKNYFRGLHFRIENQGDDLGQLAMLNFKQGQVVMHYKEDFQSTVDGETTVTRVGRRLVMTLAGNSVSLIKNDNEPASYLTAINQPWNPAGVEKIYLRGGQGAVATINLFGADADADGVPEELEALRANFKEDADGYDEDGVWLLNEANLTFYIDQPTLGDAAIEPERIYLYDVNNKRPLVDYLFDNSTNANPKKNKSAHDGMIIRREIVNGQYVPTQRGVKYRIRITNYIRDLLTKDSTNVTLGLSVTESINITSMRKLRVENENLNDFAPTAMVTNPLGTILYGNNHPDPEKRLKLELYYTKPNIQE